MPNLAPQKFAIALVLLIPLALAGCAPQPEAAPEPSSSESSGDPQGLNDDPEIDDDSLALLGKYYVDGDELLDDAPADHAAVWERFAELIPAGLRPEVTMFVAIDSEKSGGTDGAMQPNGVRPGEMYIALDASGAVEPATLDRTMLHEYAHLVTLRADQVDPDDSSAEDCPVYADPKCPLEDSYLYAYLTQFWPDNQGPEFDSSEDAIAERYDEDAFVTEYAAKNPDEDIAEVFAEWVIETAEPTGDTVVDNKLRFFDDYPELVEFREGVLALL